MPTAMLYPVEYDSESLLSFAAAATHVLPHSMVLLLPLYFLLHRQLSAVTFAAGVVLNELLCRTLKRLLNHPRPSSAPAHVLGKPGMPSSHAAFAAFLTVYLLLTLRRWRFPLAVERFLWHCLVVGCMLWICFTRVHLGYHSLDQVVAGALVGCATGALWHKLTISVFIPAFQRVESNRWVRALGIGEHRHSLAPPHAWRAASVDASVASSPASIRKRQ